MQRRTAFAAGLALGYYYGTKAGRERYEQIQAALDDLRIMPLVEKGRALVELAVLRMQETRDDRGATVLPFPNAAQG